MKISIFLLFVSVLELFASGTYAQNTRLTLSMKNASIEDVLQEIESQSEFNFFFNNQYIDVSIIVDVKAKSEPVCDILDQMFSKTDITYQVMGKQIVLFEKKENYSNTVEQQPSKISGTITDEDGKPLAGVTIQVKGSDAGTITDENGAYEISDVQEGSVLTFSFIGYDTQEVLVGKQTVINLSMKLDILGLEEVVVIGYGTIKKSDLTGSVSSVKGDNIDSYPAVTNVMNKLTGHTTGVYVMQNSGEPGSAFSVQIRGANSIKGSNEPLYVLDGFLTNGSSLNMLNSLDIESIEVLKDASATAIYGSRGANGVVLITTKQGKSGKTTIEFESSFGSQSLSKKLDNMSATEYAQLYNEQAVNDGLEPYFSEAEISAFGSGFDWQDFIFQNAFISNNTLSLNGGSDKTRFTISGNVLNQNGIVKGTGFKRYSVKANISHQINKMFYLEFSSLLTKNTISNESNTSAGDRGSSLLSGAMVAPPTLTPYNEDGSYRVLATEHPFLSGNITNPINFLNEDNRQKDKNFVLTNMALLFEPIDGLVFKIYGGLQNADSRYDHYRTLNFLNSNGTADVSVNNDLSMLNENTITYSKVFNEKHSLSAVAGFTYQNFISKSLRGSGSGFLSDVMETYDLSAAANPKIPASGYSESVLLSYLGRINYVLDNKYLFTASIRSDGSSKYSKNNKWGYFPSAAFAWKMKNEAFMQDVSFIEDFKFRASWGLTGSQAISPYQTLTQLLSGLAVFDDNLYTTFAPGSQLPADLKWETTKQINFGVDIGLFKNRHRFTVDYYVKNTRDLLNPVGLPPSLGYTTTIRNVGSIENKGFEFAVDSRILTGEFKWTLGANLSVNRNKVISLYDGQDILTGKFFHPMISDYGKILREGEAVGVFYGYVSDGYDETGNEKYKDLNIDGEVNEFDKAIIGNPNPDFIYGLNSFMSYKNITLVIFVQGSQGNDILNVSGISTIDYQGGLNTLKEVYDDHWTTENTDAKYPRITKFVTGRYSDRQIEDGSYFRIKNIQLSYSLPLNKLKNNVLSKVQVYANMDNLLTLTQYSWWDPAVNSQGQGVDLNAYPKAKTYSVGIRLSF